MKNTVIAASPLDIPVRGWMPIETAPEEGQFLVYMPDDQRSPIQVAKWHKNVKVIGNQFAFDLHKPTHWMPLPDAPNAKLTGGGALLSTAAHQFPWWPTDETT